MNDMQTYSVLYEAGRFIPLEKVDIPEGSRAIVTIIDDASDEISQRQRMAMARFRASIRASEPLPLDFDETLEQRVNITREVDL